MEDKLRNMAEDKKTGKAKAHVPKAKIEAVKRIAEEAAAANTVMIISIKNLPSAQLQKMKKDLRGKAKIEVAKKSILNRAVNDSKVPELLPLNEYIIEDSAILMSKDGGFELSGWMSENKNPIGAKEGQIVDKDIVIEEGPTELVPGPVISELGALGLQIMVEEGKITIRKSKVAVKKGDKVSAAAASIFQKLGIKPFMIGITPLAFYDKHSKKVYAGVVVDKKKVLQDLINAQAKALGLSISVAYPTKQNIGLLLAKANAQANALNKLQKTSS